MAGGYFLIIFSSATTGIPEAGICLCEAICWLLFPVWSSLLAVHNLLWDFSHRLFMIMALSVVALLSYYNLLPHSLQENWKNPIPGIHLEQTFRGSVVNEGIFCNWALFRSQQPHQLGCRINFSDEMSQGTTGENSSLLISCKKHQESKVMFLSGQVRFRVLFTGHSTGGHVLCRHATCLILVTKYQFYCQHYSAISVLLIY